MTDIEEGYCPRSSIQIVEPIVFYYVKYNEKLCMDDIYKYGNVTLRLKI